MNNFLKGAINLSCPSPAKCTYRDLVHHTECQFSVLNNCMFTLVKHLMIDNVNSRLSKKLHRLRLLCPLFGGFATHLRSPSEETASSPATQVLSTDNKRATSPTNFSLHIIKLFLPAFPCELRYLIILCAVNVKHGDVFSIAKD